MTNLIHKYNTEIREWEGEISWSELAGLISVCYPTAALKNIKGKLKRGKVYSRYGRYYATTRKAIEEKIKEGK